MMLIITKLFIKKVLSVITFQHEISYKDSGLLWSYEKGNPAEEGAVTATALAYEHNWTWPSEDAGKNALFWSLWEELLFSDQH